MEWLRDALDQVQSWLEQPVVLASTMVLASVLTAYLIEFVVTRVLGAMASKTKTQLDDQIIETIRRPVFITVILVGVGYAADMFVPDRATYLTLGTMKMIAVVIWSQAGFRISTTFLRAFSTRTGLLQPRTIPVFDMLVKITVFGAAVYFTFLAWDIDVTAWLASAGILGIAIGFAAKDTLANLFAGIFILADAPYKIGDHIVLDGDLRGRVTRIGMRSTRVLTRDDVEITIPNAVIGNSKIINETGGPYVKQRIGVQVSAAYGCDIDEVFEVLVSCHEGIDDIASYPKPEIRFRQMGDSGLHIDLLVWLEDPAARGRVLSDLNISVYKAFNKAGLEIPFPQQDVHVRQLPDGSSS